MLKQIQVILDVILEYDAADVNGEADAKDILATDVRDLRSDSFDIRVCREVGKSL